MSYELSEMDRRLGNIVRLGAVAAVDLAAAPPMVQVDIGTADEPQITDWLPWMTRRAGRTKQWTPPDVNEQVVILSPGGEIAQGVVLPGALFSDLFPANGTAQDLWRVTFPDASVVEYDSAAHVLTVNVGSGQVVVNCSTATVNATQSTTLNTPDTFCKGKLTVDGLITGKGGLAVSGGSGAAAAITGSMTVTSGELTVDGIGLKGHHHTAQGSTSPTTAAQA
jgi:phage baseplate assembly protein V